jgi:hypothetical protein
VVVHIEGAPALDALYFCSTALDQNSGDDSDRPVGATAGLKSRNAIFVVRDCRLGAVDLPPSVARPFWIAHTP